MSTWFLLCPFVLVGSEKTFWISPLGIRALTSSNSFCFKNCEQCATHTSERWKAPETLEWESPHAVIWWHLKNHGSHDKSCAGEVFACFCSHQLYTATWWRRTQRTCVCSSRRAGNISCPSASVHVYSCISNVSLSTFLALLRVEVESCKVVEYLCRSISSTAVSFLCSSEKHGPHIAQEERSRGERQIRKVLYLAWLV